MSRRRSASDDQRPHTRHSTRSGGPHPSAPADPAAQNPLIPILRSALRDGDPSAFWVASAPIITLLSEPGDSAPELPEGVDLLQTFLDVNIAETTALLHMVSVMSTAPDHRKRARDALTSRRQPMPPQVIGLARAEVRRATMFGDTFGDNLLVELALPRALRAVLTVYIEHRPVPYVKDAFVIGEPLDQVHGHYRRIMAAEGFSLDAALETLDPEEAGACLAQALDATPPNRDTAPGGGDQWPMLRPFVEFTLGLMPRGGRGYGPGGRTISTGPTPLEDDPAPEVAVGLGSEEPPGPPPWIAEDGTNLLEEFLASEEAAGLPQDEAMSQLVTYLFLLASAGMGDPLEWSSDSAGWVVGELLPSDPLLSAEALRHTPATLPALIAWAHARTGADPRQTQDLQQTIAPLLEDLPARRADPQMRARRLEAYVDLALESEDPGDLRLADLAMRVGGYDELETLDSAPLPAEPLEIDAVPEDLRDGVLEIDAHLVQGLDQVGTGLLDLNGPVVTEEFLTACRRLLVLIAVRDPSVLRRRASTSITAGSLAWIIGRGNHLIGQPPAPVRSADLLRAFGIRATPTQRGETLMHAAALPSSPTGVCLGDTRLLVASAREEILRIRGLLEVT